MKSEGECEERTMCCVICLEHTSKPHNCQRCASNAWYCCSKCESSLLDKDCPICRGKYARGRREWEAELSNQKRLKTPLLYLSLSQKQSQLCIEELCQDFPKLEILSIDVLPLNIQNENERGSPVNNSNITASHIVEAMDVEETIENNNTAHHQVVDITSSTLSDDVILFNSPHINFSSLLKLSLKGSAIHLNHICFIQTHFPVLKDLSLNSLNCTLKFIELDLPFLTKLTLEKISVRMSSSSFVGCDGINNNFGLSLTKCLSIEEVVCSEVEGLGDTLLFGSETLTSLTLSRICSGLKRIDILHAPKLRCLNLSHCSQLKHVFIHGEGSMVPNSHQSPLSPQSMDISPLLVSSQPLLRQQDHPLDNTDTNGSLSSTCTNNPVVVDGTLPPSFDILENLLSLHDSLETIHALSYEVVLGEESKWEAGLHGYSEAAILGWELIGGETFEIKPEKLAAYLNSLWNHILESAEDNIIHRFLSKLIKETRLLETAHVIKEEEEEDQSLESKENSQSTVGSNEQPIAKRLRSSVSTFSTCSSSEASTTCMIQLRLRGSTRKLSRNSWLHLQQHARVEMGQDEELNVLTSTNHGTDHVFSTKTDLLDTCQEDQEVFELPPWLAKDKDLKILMRGEIPYKYSNSHAPMFDDGVYDQSFERDSSSNTNLASPSRYHSGATSDVNYRQGGGRLEAEAGLSSCEEDRGFVTIVIALTLFGLAGTAATLPKGCGMVATIITVTMGGFGGGLSVRLWKVISSCPSSSSPVQGDAREGITIVDNRHAFHDNTATTADLNGQQKRNTKIIQFLSESIRNGPMGWIIGALIGILVSYTVASSCQIACGNNNPNSNGNSDASDVSVEVDIFSGLPLPAQSFIAVLLSSPALFEALRSAITACCLLLAMAVGAIVAACYAAQAIEKFHEASASGRSFLPGPSSLFSENGKLVFLTNGVNKLLEFEFLKNSSILCKTSPTVLFDGGLALLLSAGGIAGHSMALRGVFSFSWDQWLLRLACLFACGCGGVAASVGMRKLYQETTRLFERDPVGYVCCSIAASSAVAFFGSVLGASVGYFLTAQAM